MGKIYPFESKENVLVKVKQEPNQPGPKDQSNQTNSRKHLTKIKKKKRKPRKIHEDFAMICSRMQLLHDNLEDTILITLQYTPATVVMCGSTSSFNIANSKHVIKVVNNNGHSCIELEWDSFNLMIKSNVTEKIAYMMKSKADLRSSVQCGKIKIEISKLHNSLLLIVEDHCGKQISLRHKDFLSLLDQHDLISADYNKFCNKKKLVMKKLSMLEAIVAYTISQKKQNFIINGYTFPVSKQFLNQSSEMMERLWKRIDTFLGTH